MIVGHVAGLPLEETVVQLAPAAAAVLTGFAVVGRKYVASWGQRLRELTRSGRAAGS